MWLLNTLRAQFKYTIEVAGYNLSAAFFVYQVDAIEYSENY